MATVAKNAALDSSLFRELKIDESDEKLFITFSYIPKGVVIEALCGLCP